MTRLPLFARLLLRMSPVPADRRAEVQADLYELFELRRNERGMVHAHTRLYRDVLSLFRAPRQPDGARDHQLPSPLRGVGADLRYAARLFARQPGILLLAIAGLALGLGIATTAFSIMNVALLRGEGLVDPERAPAVIRMTDRSVSTTWRYDDFEHLRQGATGLQLEAVVMDSAQVRTSSSETDPPAASVGFVSGGFFSATGGHTRLGRTLEAADEDYARLGGPPPAVVSFGFWKSALNSDPGVIGRLIRVGRTDATIVGVAAPKFVLPTHRQLWMPMTAHGAVYNAAAGRRTPATDVQVFGRLRPDATLTEAEAQLSAVAASIPGALGAGDSGLRVRLDPGKGLGRVASEDTVLIATFVFVVIGLVLILACANVATVLVSTAITREREMGVRAALGASRRRIVRQLVTESLALGTVAAALGLLLGYWAIPIIGTMIQIPPDTDLRPDRNVFLFLGFVTILTGVGAGLAPARHGGGADLLAPLKGDSGQTRVAPRRLRALLVMTQAAVSVLLIVMATLFVRATFQAAVIDVGFDPSGVYAVSVGVGRDAGADTRGFWARGVAEVQAIPGVAAVSLTEMSPFSGSTRTSVSRQDPPVVVHIHLTGAGYFETLGIRMLAGRAYTPEEVDSKAAVAVISESTARAYFQDGSPLGQMLPQNIPMVSTRPVIIGVAADTITARLHQGNPYAIYSPLTDPMLSELLIRVAPGTTGVIDQATQRLRAIDQRADVRVESVAARVRNEAQQPRTLAMLTGFVGIVAIVLCVIGLYGLTASVVGQRSREMAVRLAIGASPRDLLRLLMWESLRPVLMGLAAGIAGALVAGRVVVAAMFFGMPPHDPLALAAAAAILLAAAALAVIVPTRRASSVDAALVLKQS